MSDYDLVRLAPDNFPDLLDLMKAVDGNSADERQLPQKYNTDVFGPANLGFLAYKRGEKIAAAYYGVFPVKERIGNKELLAA